MGKSSSKKWRESQRKITYEELNILVNHINENMKRYDKNIEGRMRHSDRVELQMKRVKPDIENEVMELY